MERIWRFRLGRATDRRATKTPGTCNTPAGDAGTTTKVSPTPVEVSAKASRAAKKTQRVDAKAAIDAKASSRTRALDAAKDEIAVKKAAKVSSS